MRATPVNLVSLNAHCVLEIQHKLVIHAPALMEPIITCNSEQHIVFRYAPMASTKCYLIIHVSYVT